MRLFILLAFIALLPGFASPARADVNPALGPMHYTRLNEAAPDSGGTYIRMKTVGQDDQQPKEEEAPSVRIWNKYKALAAGKPEMTDKEKAEAEEAERKEAEEKAAAAEKEKQEEAAAKTTQQQPAPPTGIAAIIEEYRKNKAQRSQMHSITITKPGELEPAAGETPAAGAREKPEG